ncbi:MAG: hypothetical protein GY765_15445 [bacterium]|nr:hypothetical protein [bacterium]
MSKKKKKLMKRVNPEKSNKMIFAVGGGFLLLIVVFMFFVFSGDSVTDKKELFQDTLEYLEGSEGITEVKRLPDENKVIIIKERRLKGHEIKKDFEKIARYAALKLSYKLENEEITVLLCDVKEDNPIYQVKRNDQKITEEKRFK